MDLILCTHKNTRLEILDPKKYTVKSSTQKNTGVENFRPKKIRRTPPSRLYPSTPPPPGFLHVAFEVKNTCVRVECIQEHYPF